MNLRECLVLIVAVISVLSFAYLHLYFMLDDHHQELDSIKSHYAPAHKTRSTTQHHCLIHIHGLHHTGTGVLRKFAYDAVGGKAQASIHYRTGRPEDEGQHIQHVYRAFNERVKRFPKDCNVNNVKTPGSLYYCPQQWKLANETVHHLSDVNKSQRVFEQWSRHWKMSKPYLIQKTPMLDIVLLEKFAQQQIEHPSNNLTATVHVATIRHPLMWNFGNQKQLQQLAPKKKSLIFPLMWLQVWADVLEQLTTPSLMPRYYAIVPYENLVLYPNQTRQELANLFSYSCKNHHQQQKRQVHGRRLELHRTKGTVHKYLQPKYQQKRLYQNCLRSTSCHALMQDLAPILRENFGYTTWNVASASYYQPLQNRKRILFSSSSPPRKELISQLKALAKKHSANA